MLLMIPASAGEVLDKLTILDIKLARIADAAKRANVAAERAQLGAAWGAALPDPQGVADLESELRAVNETLWEVEDALREAERAGDFGPTFVALARSVYHTNDRRAAIKKRVNERLGSVLVEEKSYAPY
jgi:hypothetical protein